MTTEAAAEPAPLATNPGDLRTFFTVWFGQLVSSLGSSMSAFAVQFWVFRETGSVTALAMMFAIMTSYTRARAESLIRKCKVGFMERPERIVLFMIGAFTNRMAAVLWVILILSVFTVADRIIYTYRELRDTREAIA